MELRYYELLVKLELRNGFVLEMLAAGYQPELIHIMTILEFLGLYFTHVQPHNLKEFLWFVFARLKFISK